jgi:hypothetical protein
LYPTHTVGVPLPYLMWAGPGRQGERRMDSHFAQRAMCRNPSKD